MITRGSYLKALRDNLRNVPPQEAEDIMQYYIEYFDEAGPENEQKVIEELGSAWQLAQKVSAGYVIQNIESGEGNQTIKQKASNTWVLVTAIVTSPVWIPLIFALAVVAFSLLIALFAIVVAFFASAVGFAVAALVMLVAGVVTMFESIGGGLIMFGAALLFAAATIIMVLLAVGVIKLVNIIIVFTAKQVVKK